MNIEHDDVIIPSSFSIDGQDVTVKIIGSSAFSQKELETLELPNTLIKIDYYGFYGNNLKKVELPEGVEYVGINSFASNRLEEVTIPTSLKVIHQGAFRNNIIGKLKLPEGVQSIRKAFHTNKIDTLTIPLKFII